MEQTNVYTIKIQNFEGPFDLLFHLIEKNKMDIYDIQIAEITEQYMNYLNTMQELDLDITSEFLVMASTLLLIKSKMLLPEANKAGDEQEELKDELVNRLVEYKKYKEFTKDLRDRYEYYSQIFYKPHEIIKILPVKIVNKEYSPELITTLYKNICERNLRKLNPNTKSIEEIMAGDKVTVRGMIRDILRELVSKAKFKFAELFTDRKTSKVEIVTAFLALLGVAKIKRVKIEQEKVFGDIIVRKLAKK